MVLVPIRCPHCNDTNVIKHGRVKEKQRYICRNAKCKKTFFENYTYTACSPDIRAKIFMTTVNGNGTRAIARTLGISPNTVTATLRSVELDLWYVNYDYI